MWVKSHTLIESCHTHTILIVSWANRLFNIASILPQKAGDCSVHFILVSSIHFFFFFFLIFPSMHVQSQKLQNPFMLMHIAKQISIYKHNNKPIPNTKKERDRLWIKVLKNKKCPIIKLKTKVQKPSWGIPKSPSKGAAQKAKAKGKTKWLLEWGWDPPDNLSFPSLSIFWLGIGSHLGHHCLYGLNDKKSTSRGVWTKGPVQPQIKKGTLFSLLHSQIYNKNPRFFFFKIQFFFK